MIRKILVPTDFSASAARAADAAATLARSSGAEVVLLHVRDELVYVMPDATGFVPGQVYAEVERAAATLLDEQAALLRDKGVQARSESVLGSVHQQILLAAEREHADLIVMGTHGRSGFRRFVLGSVAERVARTATVPVLIVPGEPSRNESATAPSPLSASRS